MKKILLLVAVFSLVASSAFATSDGAYAAADGAAGVTYTPSSGPALTVKASKGVSLAYESNAATAATTYVCGSYHSSGTKSFASSSGDTKIFFADATAKAIPGSPPATASASADMTGAGFAAL